MKGVTLVHLLGHALIDGSGVAGTVALALTLGTGLLGRVLPAALVLSVVESGKGQNIEEE